jgi:hypothetical protein
VGVTPYVYGGASPAGADCSGYVQFTAAWAGVSVARTTQGEWATLPAGDGSRGDLVLFDVPSDGPPQPQHVGICLGDGTMVNAPHTGTLVQVNPIWNIPGSITVMGYRRIPFAPPAPPPPPIPVPSLTSEVTMNAYDATSGGTWVVDPTDGHVETLFGAPYLGALNNPPDAYNWKQVGEITGITPWTNGYAIIVKHNQPFGNGAYYSAYTFPRS